jgi:hypothetical protein
MFGVPAFAHHRKAYYSVSQGLCSVPKARQFTQAGVVCKFTLTGYLHYLPCSYKLCRTLCTVNSPLDITLWTLYRSYFRGISAIIELEGYNVMGCSPYLTPVVVQTVGTTFVIIINLSPYASVN